MSNSNDNTCGKNTAERKTSTSRVLSHRDSEAKKGRVRREYSATPPEHEELKKTLKNLRK